MEPVMLEQKPGLQLIQLPRRPVPYHNRPKLSEHLDLMRKEGVIEDMDPWESIDTAFNLVITNKKAPREIRMNMDATPINKGRQDDQVQHQHCGRGTPRAGGPRLGHIFHRVPLSTITSSKLTIFQSHKELHRMKRLLFGPKAESGILNSV